MKKQLLLALTLAMLISGCAASIKSKEEVKLENVSIGNATTVMEGEGVRLEGVTGQQFATGSSSKDAVLTHPPFYQSDLKTNNESEEGSEK